MLQIIRNLKDYRTIVGKRPSLFYAVQIQEIYIQLFGPNLQNFIRCVPVVYHMGAQPLIYFQIVCCG